MSVWYSSALLIMRQTLFLHFWIWAHFVSRSGQFNVAEMICEFWGLHLKKAYSSYLCPCRMLPETDMLWKRQRSPNTPPLSALVTPILGWSQDHHILLHKWDQKKDHPVNQKPENDKLMLFQASKFWVAMVDCVFQWWPPNRSHPTCSSHRA